MLCRYDDNRAEETLQVLLETIYSLGDGVSEDELARLKVRIKSALVMEQESSAARSHQIAVDWFHLGRVPTREEVLQEIDLLTCQSLLDHFQIHRPKNFSLVTVGSQPWSCLVELLTHKSQGGPEVVAMCDPSAFTTSIGWFVNTGARDEAPEIAGVSHFLEHMVFKGTKRRTAEQVNSELDHLGAQSNAYTSEESTVFYACVLPECQDQAVDLLTDIMRPSLREEDFQTERQVVLEEIAMYDDQPPYGAMERAMELFFGEHSLSRRVLGTAETVGEMTIEQMVNYHKQRYTLDNMFLVASGKVDFERLVEQTESLVGSWRGKSVTRATHSPKFGTSSTIIERPASHQQYTVKIWPGVGCNDPARYALRLLSSVIADESGSRLFWELIDTD